MFYKGELRNHDICVANEEQRLRFVGVFDISN